ncbi:MAG: hypothetical protein GWM92_01215 [Gemmatimonadetes bacterium]|nr:hypothetical protein [Gemmatimonadota bacterium]NIR77081.1 hypothetical protein [Gemmatimonadota bacterium]NIT85601.1 hypothetical protein [Gemmatimonadota bacterium]NIU29433.1 hypothetical protein [Gemmatimonadota bacterium]NIU34498.1 hypothetical protein [Gemmatimonadota bacterium]
MGVSLVVGACAFGVGVLAGDPGPGPGAAPTSTADPVPAPVDTVPATRDAAPAAADTLSTTRDAGPAATDTLPVPVLLVPGWSDEASQLRALRERFIGEGWPGERVSAIEFRDPVGSNREHARELADALERLLEESGAPAADVVAHSMGGLALRYLFAREGAGLVRKVVFLGTPNRGTVAAHLAWGAGGEEMEPGSPFLDSLNALPAVPEGVDALAVRTPLDLRVIPGESALLPEGGNARNVEVCCPTHPGLVEDREVFRIVVRFLRGEEALRPSSDVAGRRGRR